MTTKLCKVCNTEVAPTKTYCSKACFHEWQKGIYLPTEEEIYKEAERLRKLRREPTSDPVEIKVYESRVYWR